MVGSFSEDKLSGSEDNRTISSKFRTKNYLSFRLLYPMKMSFKKVDRQCQKYFENVYRQKKNNNKCTFDLQEGKENS